ncbi:universal stress protein UspA-like protein [Rheinheimera sp. A13L]|uniref:universal stress protein n=1 Tax=Rheinheimera sp. A13L TaxID=506534 RepID=UPI0002124C15|nr:universal stress protein [Rheinheimera sp. A13L]EGM77575.1 universal stress protein UspA-like protein [Rheinheimera sp. A13L]
MKRFKNILLVAKPQCEHPFELEAALTLAEQNSAEITLLMVLPALSSFHLIKPERPQQDIEKDYVQHHLNELLARAGRYQQRAEIRCKVVIGTEFLEVIRSVLRNHHDLVIKTAEPASWVKRLFGGTDMHLLRKCPCPLWLLKPDVAPNYSKIAATVDFNPDEPQSVEQPLNKQILELASSIAIHNSASLHILHAWQVESAGVVLMWSDNPESAEAEYNQSLFSSHQAGINRLKLLMAKWIGQQAYDYCTPHFELLRGDASHILAKRVEELDPGLVVMGTVARTGIAGFLIGNTAEALLEQLNCSVLAVKPLGFVTPVTLEE